MCAFSKIAKNENHSTLLYYYTAWMQVSCGIGQAYKMASVMLEGCAVYRAYYMDSPPPSSVCSFPASNMLYSMHSS